MIIDQYGAEFEYEGVVFKVGAPVIATEKSHYEELVGVITEIRTGDDRETENDTPDIYCSFDIPTDMQVRQRVEERFSAEYCQPMHISDIAIDFAIMSPDMLRPAKEYRIPLTWRVWGTIDVVADTLEDAVNKALGPDMPLPADPEYICDSLIVDWDGIAQYIDEIESNELDRKYLDQKLAFEYKDSSLNAGDFGV